MKTKAAEQVIYTDETGAKLDVTAALAACEKRGGIVISYGLSPFTERQRYDLGVHGIESVYTGDDEIEISLMQRGEVLGRVEAPRREQVRALRDLLAEHDLLGNAQPASP